MKLKIIILTLVFIFAGSVVLGLTLINLTQEEAYESAAENNIQFEIDKLNLELKQIIYDKNLKTASLPTLSTYNGQLTKYYTPFNSETNLIVKTAENERAFKQLKIDIFAAAVSQKNAAINYDNADKTYNETLAAYTEAINDSTVSTSDKLSLKYTMESSKISLHQSQNTLDSAQRKLDGLVDRVGVSVLLPNEYSNPYGIDFDAAYELALKTDINIYRSARSAEAAAIKFEIAERLFDEDEEMYISALAGSKSAELAYEKALLSLQLNVYDDIDNLKNRYDSISLAELNMEIKLDSYNAAKNQYTAGILSLTSLESSEDAYIAAQKQLASKIHDYILASMRFTMNYGYGF